MFKRLGQSISKFLGNSLTSAGIWNWARPGQWSRTDLIRQYTRVMFSVISAIAEEAAKIEFMVFQEMGDEDKPVNNHEFVREMRRPNPDQSQFQFLELHYTYLKLVGESYWYVLRNNITKKPQEFYLLRPDLMQVVVPKENNPLGLVGGYILSKPDGTKVPFDKPDVLHFKMPNPNNPYYGMGVVEAARTYIQTEEFASEWTKNSLFNSGRPSGIVSVKGVIDSDQFNELKKKFKEEYSGTQNAGKTLFIKSTDGIDYSKLGMELGEVALKEMKDMTRDDIMMMFRVSKTMLGISEDVSLNNARESRIMFKENIILSEWDRLTDHLTAFLLPQYGSKQDLYVGYKHPDLQSGTDKVNEWTQGFNKWLTRNDIRKERGLKALKGGDVIREPIGLVPVVDDKPREPAKPTEPPKNPKDKPTEEPPKEEKKLVKAKKLERKDIFWQNLVNVQESWIPLFHDVVAEEFDKQKKEILAKHKKAGLAEWEFDVEVSKTRLMGQLVPLGVKIMEEVAKLALELADDADTDFLINERVQEYIRERIDRMTNLMNEATLAELEASIAEGIKEGEPISKLRARVQDIYKQADEVRAELIARTETIAASNEGALEAYRQSPLVGAKEWYANPDACAFCSQFNGKVVGLDEDFAALGSTIETDDGEKHVVNYEDIKHPPLHPNCRCTLLPVARA